MKKHNVNVESVIRSVCYAHDAGIGIRRCYIQICASLFLFLYRRAGLRDVRPPVHDGRRALQQGKPAITHWI